MSKLVITWMEMKGIPCVVSVLYQNQKAIQLSFAPRNRRSILGNIYIGQVEKISENIQAAFVRFQPEQTGYYSLTEQDTAIVTTPKRNLPLRPQDQLLVQISKEAMKGKLPSLTTNLNLTGKYLVLTTGKKQMGISSKLDKEERAKFVKWLDGQQDSRYGIIVRTNAVEASKEEFFQELKFLKNRYEKLIHTGMTRTCFSMVHQADEFYLTAIRDSNTRELEEIITDIPQLYDQIDTYLKEECPEDTGKLRLYKDNLLPLYKLYGIESVLDEVQKEKIWLKSGGFLVIQQTEAFVSIDVNSGKYTGKKKLQETYRKINLEAAQEIARQLRLRNLSGIILIDFINMVNPDHQKELMNVLQKHLKKDPVKGKVVDMTALHIVEVTRKKIRRPLWEDFKELESRKRETEEDKLRE